MGIGERGESSFTTVPPLHLPVPLDTYRIPCMPACMPSNAPSGAVRSDEKSQIGKRRELKPNNRRYLQVQAMTMSHPASFGRRCLQCDYDLRGSLRSRCCPECGWQFHPSTIVLECWPFSEWPRLWNLPFYVIIIASMLALLVLGSMLASGWWRVGCALLAGVYLALAIRGMKSYVPTTFSNSA